MCWEREKGLSYEGLNTERRKEAEEGRAKMREVNAQRRPHQRCADGQEIPGDGKWLTNNR